jgi:hypothetical protein
MSGAEVATASVPLTEAIRVPRFYVRYSQRESPLLAHSFKRMPLCGERALLLKLTETARSDELRAVADGALVAQWTAWLVTVTRPAKGLPSVVVLCAHDALAVTTLTLSHVRGGAMTWTCAPAGEAVASTEAASAQPLLPRPLQLLLATTSVLADGALTWAAVDGEGAVALLQLGDGMDTLLSVIGSELRLGRGCAPLLTAPWLDQLVISADVWRMALVELADDRLFVALVHFPQRHHLRSGVLAYVNMTRRGHDCELTFITVPAACVYVLST